MTDCDCEPQRSRWLRRRTGIQHEAECPNAYSHLHTAQDIAVFRECWMLWNQQQRIHGGLGDAFTSDLTARVSQGVTARAVELGLEQP